jgi:predicted RNase H-like HicB family nuclease
MGHTTYVAHAIRDGGWWAIEVPELPGVFTQARRLDQAEAMVRDVVSLWLEVPEDSFDVDIIPELGDLTAQVAQARAAKHKAEQAEREASTAMRQAAARLLDTGLTLRDAGAVLDVSYQRVQQLTRKTASSR